MLQIRSLSLIAPVGLFLIFSLFLGTASAQVVLNGQVSTNGLAIVDSPQPNTPLHAGSPLVLAIDVSGDGKLPQAAAIPGSGQATRFDSLEIYLVSNTASLNLTVSTGSGLLTQESGSTVKHLNWPVPTCIQPGEYNLTLYEASHIQETGFFAITPIPVQVQNAAASSKCATNNPLQPQPQASDPYPGGPWFGPGSVSSSISAPAPTVYDPITLTVGSSGVSWPITVQPTGESATYIIYATGDGDDDTTVTETAAAGTKTVTVTPTGTPTSVTVVFVSLETIISTSTAPGETLTVTNTLTVLSTTTALMSVDNPSKAGFLPINAATPRTLVTPAMIIAWTLCISVCLLFLQ